MQLPNITEADVASLVTGASSIAHVGKGGQKLVFKGDFGGTTYAVKFALVPPDPADALEIQTRAAREVATMRNCPSAHMVKPGPVGITVATVRAESVLYFTEQFIDGEDLDAILKKSGPMPVAEVVRLGLHMADAIKGLQKIRTIHRDLKPKNIMRRRSDGAFILLDAGFAFDLDGASASNGKIVGTLPYFPPERFDYGSRRTAMDFRSDMFCLGVTMYEMAAGVRPFYHPGDMSHDMLMRIRTERPAPPSAIRAGIPPQLDQVILRMMGKSPHLRYRTVELLEEALRAIGAP